MNGANAPVWAHATGQNILPVFWCGPTKLPKNLVRSDAGAPVWAQESAKNMTTKMSVWAMVWAHGAAEILVPVLLSGPRKLPKKCCQCFCVGP